MMKKETREDFYRRHLVGNYCKFPMMGGYHDVVDVRVTTQASETFGCLRVQLLDGSWHSVYNNGKFWPSLKDIDILTVDEYFEKIWPFRNGAG